MNRRHAIQLLGAVSVSTLFPQTIFAKASDANRGEQFLPKHKFVVGHRGACAYAPENTLASYQLAIKQGADFIEQDLHITKDNILICSHDSTLERVTNVAEVFPDRFVEKIVKGKTVKQWPIHSFTLKEIKQLDAGAAFDPKFKGEQIPTWQEAIELIKGKAGLCPETKGPESYRKLGFDMEKLFVEVLKKNGLEKPRRKNSTPILVQSFSKESLQKLISQYEMKWPLLWLTGVGFKWTNEILDEAAKHFAVLGPFKEDVTPQFVTDAHLRGLKVVSFTFRSADAGSLAKVKEEMRHFLYDLETDGMFTDNPDQFPRQQ